MINIYKRDQRTGNGVFTSDKAVVAIAGGAASSGSWVGALVQNVRWNYPQQVRMINEIGSNLTYRAVGRSLGQMTIGRISGTPNSPVIEEALFDACNTGGTMTLKTLPSGCGGIGGGQTYIFDGLFVVDFGVTVTAEDLLIQENITLSFVGFNRLNN